MDADITPKKPRRSRWLPAALLVLAMLAATYLLAPQTIGEQSRRTLVGVLQKHYAGITVTIGSGKFVSDVGLILEDLQFTSPANGSSPSRSILRINRLIVETDLIVDNIMKGEIPFDAKRIIAAGVEVDIWPVASDQWSITRLWPPPKMGPGCPRFEVRDGRLRLHKDGSATRDGRALEFDALQIAVDVVPSSSIEPSYHQFKLRASSEFADQLKMEGRCSGASLSIQGSAKDLRIDPMFTGRLPIPSPDVAKHLNGLTANGNFSFALRKVEGQPTDFVAKMNCNEGRYEHPLLPQPIEKIRGLVTMRPQGAEIQAAQANLGEAVCRVSGSTSGWTGEMDLNLRLIATNLMFNERLASSLPESAQRSLDRIRPHGHLDIDSRIERTEGKWSADAVADLHGVDVCVDKFPYPVSQLIGKVNFRDSQSWAEQLSGRVGNERINVSFLKSEANSGQPSWVRLKADGPIAVDSTLLESLTPRGEPQSKLEKFVRSLSPRGSIHLVDGQWDTSATGQKTQFVDLRITDGNLRYDGFPYPLYDVVGQVISRNDTVSLLNFTGKNSDNAAITCEGMYENLAKSAPGDPHGDWRAGLRFQAVDLPLDETIRAALPAKSQQTWDALSPAGVLDFIDVQVSHAASFPSPELILSAKQETRKALDGRTVSLRPTMLPYRLDIMEGAVRFDGQQVVIESLDARHDSTRLAADGRCVPATDGQWLLEMNVRSGSRLHPDTELINSLPTAVRGAFERLQLRGPLSIRGTTSILLPDLKHPDPTIDWGLTVQLEGNRIGDVGPVHDLRGEIVVQGKRDGLAVSADGVVSIDSMHVDDKQVTGIRGPFAIRDDRLLLGETIAVLGEHIGQASAPKTISPIEGRLFGGIASLSGEAILSNGSFDVTMAIRDGDVATLLADLGETHSTVVGKVDGQVRLEGTVGAIHLLKGSGSGKLSDANLYQIPILVQFFGKLRIEPSEAVAFTDGEVRFSIYGDNVTFNQVQLWGDLIALHGSGTLNRTKEVDLTFNTRVSPQNFWSEVTRPFGENQFTLSTITVKGPISDPVIERRALNTVNETLERLFPGIAAPVQKQRPIPARIGKIRDKVLK